MLAAFNRGSLMAATLAVAAIADGGGAAQAASGPARFLKWILGFDAGEEGVLGGGGVGAGAIWVIPFEGGEPRRLTEGDGYARPLFVEDGAALLARQGERLVRITLDDGAEQELATVEGLIAPVAQAEDGEVLAMVQAAPLPRPAAASAAGVRMLEAPDDQAWADLVRATLRERKAYDGGLAVEVAVDPASFRKARETTDVFAVEGDSRRQLTFCHPESCAQPTLSPARRLVAFIRAPAP